MNELEKKISLGHIWSIYAPFESRAKCKRHRAGQ